MCKDEEKKLTVEDLRRTYACLYALPKKTFEYVFHEAMWRMRITGEVKIPKKRRKDYE